MGSGPDVSKGLFENDKFKATYNAVEINFDAAKELDGEKKKFRRAKAEHIKKRGFDMQEDGTRAAISEQLQ
ncbi:hypothetical protein Tco_0973936 [Tanacetum coccineum]|uniref:Uncharacterized protein n=1 Tax=Tanacetum coccineum TaxID=301880 RepID=A0ABQ5EA56_9ASTR